MTKSITWTPKTQKLAGLVPADYNPRVLSEKERTDLTTSIERFGQAEPLVMNTDGTIIGGHQRVLILADLGVKDAMVMVPSRKLSKVEERELNVRLNKNTGQWDWGKLGEFFDIEDLKEWGFDEDELKSGIGLADSSGVDIDPDRMMLLTIVPPETPHLRDRAVVRFDDIEHYRIVKAAVVEGKLTAEKILKMVEEDAP